LERFGIRGDKEGLQLIDLMGALPPKRDELLNRLKEERRLTPEEVDNIKFVTDLALLTRNNLPLIAFLTSVTIPEIP